jgi:SAM-dependent methyltransferase
MTATATVRFEWTETAYPQFEALVERLVFNAHIRDVCELGAGANPLLTTGLAAQSDVHYTLVDTSEQELAKAPAEHIKRVADVMEPGALGYEEFDLVISRFLIEHVPDVDVLHRAVYRALRPGGRAAHFFPTLYAPPFLLNKILPEAWTERALPLIQANRDREGAHAKFPARYQGCRGPTIRQMNWLRSHGFEIENYVGCFGHRAYYLKFSPLCAAHDRLAKHLVAHPIANLTSFGWVVVRKPT